MPLAVDEFERQLVFSPGTNGTAECRTMRNGQSVDKVGCRVNGVWCYGARWDAAEATAGTELTLDPCLTLTLSLTQAQ